MQHTQQVEALQDLERNYGDILEAPLDLGNPEVATILPSREDAFRPAPPRETSAMREKIDAAAYRFPSARSKQDIKRAIIQEWLTGCYNEDDALYWLVALKLLRGAQRGDPYDRMCTIAKAAFGDVELPDRASAPAQGYADPELLAALAPARAGGGGA